jgi:hypothetical protein
MKGVLPGSEFIESSELSGKLHQQSHSLLFMNSFPRLHGDRTFEDRIEFLRNPKRQRENGLEQVRRIPR